MYHVCVYTHTHTHAYMPNSKRWTPRIPFAISPIAVRVQCAVVAVNLARLAKSVADAQMVWIDGFRMSADCTKTEIAHLDAVVAKRDPGHSPEFFTPRIIVGAFAAAWVQRTILPKDLTRLS